MFGEGTLSGLLGIGSGAVKVLAMYQSMKLPFKVSTPTSNLMIGVTAAASAGIYLSRGYIDLGIPMPVMLGVLAGSIVGTRLLVKARVPTLKIRVCCRDRCTWLRHDLQRRCREGLMSRPTLVDHAFFGSLLLRLQGRESRGVATMATDGRSVG